MSRPEDASTPPEAPRAGFDLRLRRARVEDAENWARIMAEESVYPMLLQLPYGDAAIWRARLTETCAPGSAHVMLCAEVNGEAVGGAGLHPVSASPRRRHVMALGIHVDPAWQGRGVGRALVQGLCDLADRWLGLLRIELEVYTDNHRAQNLYRRFGFVEEGVRRCDALRDGAYVDTLIMGRLNPTPLRGFVRA